MLGIRLVVYRTGNESRCFEEKILVLRYADGWSVGGARLEGYGPLCRM